MGSVLVDRDRLDSIYKSEWRSPTPGPDQYPLFPEELFPRYHHDISQLLLELDEALCAGPDGRFEINACPAGQRLLATRPACLSDVVLTLLARYRHGWECFDRCFSDVARLTAEIVCNVAMAHPEFQTLQRFRGSISFALEQLAKRRPGFNAVQMESLVRGVADNASAWAQVGLAAAERFATKGTMTPATIDTIRLILARLEAADSLPNRENLRQRTGKLLKKATTTRR